MKRPWILAFFLSFFVVVVSTSRADDSRRFELGGDFGLSVIRQSHAPGGTRSGTAFPERTKGTFYSHAVGVSSQYRLNDAIGVGLVSRTISIGASNLLSLGPVASWHFNRTDRSSMYLSGSFQISLVETGGQSSQAGELGWIGLQYGIRSKVSDALEVGPVFSTNWNLLLANRSGSLGGGLGDLFEIGVGLRAFWIP